MPGGGPPRWRWRWLGRPWFLLSVALLGLNDHVLKHRFPGWWTGKASDVAGVVVVATLAAVVLGPRRGVVLAAASFALLKTVPGVAELAAPILGGPTLRDPTDLIALVALIPLALVLHRIERVHVSARGRWGEAQSAVTRGRPADGRWRRAAGSAVPLVGALTAVLVTTATSCGPNHAVIEVTARGDTLYAFVARGYQSPQWAQSTDGGRSWHLADAAPPGRDWPDRLDVYAEGPLLGSASTCTAADVCYRVRDQSLVERQVPGEAWVEDLWLSREQRLEAHAGCRGGDRGILASVAATASAPEDVIVSFGAEGVLVRNGRGDWTRAGVLGAPPRESEPVDWLPVVAVMLFGPLVALGLGLGQQRLPGWRLGMVVAFAGWAVVAPGVGMLVLFGLGGPGPHPDPGVTRAGLILSAVITVVAVLLARRTPRPKPVSPIQAIVLPWSNLPPPPPPPPSPPPSKPVVGP